MEQNSRKEVKNHKYIPAFSFKVSIGDFVETDFQEVSGIQVELETEEVAEGGINDYVHKLPKKQKYSNLVLKRAILPDSSELIEWAKNAIEKFDIKPCLVIVSLMHFNLEKKESEPVKKWDFAGAYPVKLQFSDLNAKENTLVIETLELTYQKFTYESVK